MTSTDTMNLTEKAVVGRRVTLIYYRDLKLENPPTHPGIITEVNNDGRSAWVRPDGKRYSLAVRTDYQGLTYLDEVVPVPKLPMGPFTPAVEDMFGVWKGVPLSTIGEDGDDLVLLTDDQDKARDAAVAYDSEIGVDVASVDYGRLRAVWAVFEWQPDGAVCPWTVRLDAREGDDHAIRIHHLPA